MIVNAFVATVCSIFLLLLTIAVRLVSKINIALIHLDVYLSIGSMMQLSKANLRGLSTSSRKSQLAQKVTGEKLMMAVQCMMARHSQQADAVA